MGSSQVEHVPLLLPAHMKGSADEKSLAAFSSPSVFSPDLLRVV
jgi:hypothetical protein